MENGVLRGMPDASTGSDAGAALAAAAWL